MPIERILAIDPGACAGWAIFEGAELDACGVEHAPKVVRPLSEVDRVIIERPHAGDSKASKDDVIVLAIRAGEWGGLARALYELRPEYITPNKWKGSLGKDLAAKRIWARLSAEEQKRVSQLALDIPKSKHHNTMDAIGIGLHAVGRGLTTR